MDRFQRFVAATIAFFAAYAAIGGLLYLVFSDNLPRIEHWSFQPKRVTRVLSADGRHLKDFLEENRELLTYQEIPRAVHDALIAAEDQRFYSHWGIDVRRVIGSLVANVRSLDIVGQGASTLTQQLARNAFAEVGQQRSAASARAVLATYARKIREQITAVQIERMYTKQEILTMYLNTVFFGHNCYGLKAAARYYFDKDVDQLEVDECALLVGILPAPSTYSPRRDLEAATRKRNQVLASMVQTGALSAAACRQLQRRPVRTQRSERGPTYGLAPYFLEHVRQQLEEQYGSALYRDGLTITTTLDTRLQQIAEKHYRAELERIQARVDQYLALQPDTLPRPGSGRALVQAAFVAIDPGTGSILALIGGRDFGESMFDRATQARRQAGSAFKPFVYTAAIDNNRFTVDLVADNALSLWENGARWEPDNYDHKFLGWITLRDALKQSRNVATIWLTDQIGPGLVRRYARSMGITTPIHAVPSIGIGTSDVRLIDLVAAYAVYANRGIHVEPFAIRKVTGRDGATLFEQDSGRKREALRPAVAVIMTDLLRSVVDDEQGTGYGLRRVYGFQPAAAGKTGTTDDYKDAWFIGFTPHLAAGVWVGMDDPALHLWPRQSGAVAALPLWARFMAEVYERVPPYSQRRAEGFEYPANLVVSLPVCEDSHRLATRYCPRQTAELFIAGEPLPATCPVHGTGPRAPGRTRRF